ncbi:remodeling and spacing factor 1 isoform X1 [Photinus pyralis]|uniref:remodeling and spacing factor 1 isoform X1 n=1 Tax=Photinus pyralis TaxID=7054 RepID=UPI00126769A8|nr:remodeling and spacing factor 1 isoform X1 [Photinus pyralis]
MASDSEACCESDPNFAVICGFLEKFGMSCGLTSIDFVDLQYMLENNQEVPQQLVDLHVKLLRKARKSVSSERWERAVIKFCHSFCSQDAWEIERFGYKKARLSSKLRILKELLESQFDYNVKFKNEVNKLSAEELRTQPLGRDQLGHTYWFQSDSSCQIRVYKEDPDEETWALVAKNRDGLVDLISQLNDDNPAVVNEDSNSLESEKPVIDTGQTDSNSNSSKVEEPTKDLGDAPVNPNVEEPPETEIDNVTPSADINVAVALVDSSQNESNGNVAKVNEEVGDFENSVVNLKLKVKKSMIEELNKADTEKLSNEDDQKLALNLRIKADLPTVTTEVKKVEVTGVKERYIRSDSTSSAPHRKAVDSAGFDLHTNYLKRPIHDEEDLEEPSYVKRPRLDRPTLLGNKKKKSYSDEEYDEVSEEIAEPLMLVKGDGNGHDNKTENGPIVGDVIEEPIMRIAGEGSGFDCETGNDHAQASVSASSKEDKTENVDIMNNGNSGNSDITLKASTVVDNSVTNAVQNVQSDKGKEDQVNAEHVKEVLEEEPTTSNKSIFFFGPGSLQMKPTLSPIKKDESLLADDSINGVEAVMKDKPRSIVGSRRKSEKPVRKICASDLDSKETSPQESGDALEKGSDNTIINSNHVPISITKGEESSDNSKCVDNNVVEVPINKTDVKSDRSGLPNAKSISADKPKSKLENVLEKINQGKITKKTDSLDLSNKLMTNNDSKSVDKVTYSIQSSIETIDSTALVASKLSSKEPNSIITNNISGETLSLNSTLASIDNTAQYNKSDNEESLSNHDVNLKDDIPNLEDNSIMDKPHSNSIDLSPPPLVCEVLQIERENETETGNEITKTKIGNSADAALDKIKNDAEKSSTIVEEASNGTVTKRITRRTRSCADKVAESSDDIEGTISSEENKSSKLRRIKKKDNRASTEIDRDLEVLATNRELRERKVIENKQKSKPKLTQIKKDEQKRNTKNNKTKKNSKDDEVKVVNLEDVEEQIVSYEIAPTKKLKAGSADVSDQESKTTDEKSHQKESEDSVEPVCSQKRVALLTDEEKTEETEQTPNACVEVNDGDSSDIAIVPESDPLACSEEDSKHSEPVMTLATFQLDVEDTNSAMRVTRKRAAQQSVDTLRDSTQKKMERIKKHRGKKAKLKKKRSPDRKLRRSIEDKKSKDISSSEDDPPDSSSLREDDEVTGKPIKERRESNRSSSPMQSSGDSNSARQEQKEKKPRQIRKTLLGLEISEETENILREDAPMGVRQSRRIAQLKIKEEAERRKLEELTLQELKEEKMKKGKKDIDKDYKSEKKRRSKPAQSDDETTTGDGESDEKKKRKKKRKHRDPRKHFDVHNPWKSSSGSSSSVEEEEEEEIEEDEYHPLVIKSDHEFSPESDLEGVEVQPMKRARTARKESDTEEEVDDCPCQKCGQSDHPEWILLCDSCDSGWHCSCLRPALLVIPEGDWFCPPCQHATLVKKLEVQLLDYDKRVKKKDMETRRKERLAYVGISLDNVLPSKEYDEHRIKVKHVKEERSDGDDDKDASEGSESDDSDSESESVSSSESDSEPIYQLRKRRQAHSYRFNDYDDLINSAIQDELDAVKGAGNQGRGKDISTIVNAEKAETLLNDAQVGVDPVNRDDQPTDLTMKSSLSDNLNPIIEPLPPVVPPDYDKKPDIEESDDEIVRPVRKIISKKKHRKLNSLDVSSGDDAESDEDFKGSSADSEEEEDDYVGSESSDDLEVRKPRSHKGGPIRRSTRARISRYDRDFINDDSDSDGSGPRRKKNRFVWDESESEESDRSWGRRRRKAATARSRRKPSDKAKRPKKKKKKIGEDSDPEAFKSRPNIKLGGDDEEVGRRTRGKKINYLEALGSDSDDDGRRKPPRIEESDDEYAVHEDEELQQRLQNENDSDESGVENVLRDLPLPLNPRPKPKGRGKAGLKIPRKPKDPTLELFPPIMTDLPPTSTIARTEIPILQQTLESQSLIPSQIIPPPLIMDPMLLHEHESQDLDDEPNPIEQINKNVEQMNEQEMEKMMEEEEYANRQLQLVALQIEKEKKRKEREVQRLEKLMQLEQKVPKKRGRKPKNPTLNASANLIKSFPDSALLLSSNAELSEPPGISLPMFSELAPTSMNADGSPKKRRGRGKGKKTLAAEAAAAAASNKNIDMEIGLEGPTSSSSNTVSPAPDSPLHGSKLGIAAPPQPFSQSQPTPSVITRMLQSQPGQNSFPPSSVSKYFGGHGNDPQLGAYHPGNAGPRGPYQQPPIPHFPVIRSGPPPLRLHSPGAPNLPPMYHAHRSLDPSPSGGGPINVPNTNRDRQSPLVVPPPSQSPLGKGDPTPPPYTRPPLAHFSPSSSNTQGARPLPIIPSHLQQHRSPNISQFHPTLPPNYHYGSYPPPPPLTPDEGQSSPSYSAQPFPEQYPEGGPPIQTTESPTAPVTTTSSVVGKTFDEGEEGGEFVGLVSYFSSQREDDLDT